MFRLFNNKKTESPMVDNIEQEEDLYVVLDITTTDVVKTMPMKKAYIMEYILQKFEDQPLKYFNETNRIKVVHLKSGLIKTLKLKIDI